MAVLASNAGPHHGSAEAVHAGVNEGRVRILDVVRQVVLAQEFVAISTTLRRS